MTSRHLTSLLNVSLRVAGLVAKLALALFMGRYFSLEDLGIYGLIFGIVMMAVAILGFRLDYTVSRRLVSATPLEAALKMRDQTYFYLVNYAVAAVLILLFWLGGPKALSAWLLLITFVLVVLESYGNMIYVNMNSLGRPTLANVLFFFRSGFWIVPILGLWILRPDFRTIDSVLMAWIIGAAGSVVVNLVLLRGLPWAETRGVAVDWDGIFHDLRKCIPIWIGGLGLSGGAYVDRFVVAHFLGLKLAGVAAFYFSFTYALLTLVQSGVLTIAYPRMIKFRQAGDMRAFWKETREAAISVAGFAGALSIGIGICVPLVGHLMHREELAAYAPTLWLMLAGIFIRSNADTLYYVLFASNRDVPVWLGNLLFLIPAFGFNALLVPIMGLNGIGVGAILSAILLLVWRGWFVMAPMRQGGRNLTSSRTEALENA